MDLITRADITQQTLDSFLGKPFTWKERDCGTLADFHLAAAGIKTPFDQTGNYTTARGALRAIRKIGFQTLEDMADEYCERIPPAFALNGDLLGFEGEAIGRTKWAALGINLGQGRALAFVNVDGQELCTWGDAKIAQMAWRIG